MSNILKVIREQRLIEVQYFVKTPPSIIWRAEENVEQLTPEEFHEALVFCGKHVRELAFKSYVSNEEIIEAVKQAGGQGLVKDASICDYTLELPHSKADLQSASNVSEEYSIHDIFRKTHHRLLLRSTNGRSFTCGTSR